MPNKMKLRGAKRIKAHLCSEKPGPNLESWVFRAAVILLRESGGLRSNPPYEIRSIRQLQ
jgi:hypothetical protein